MSKIIGNRIRISNLEKELVILQSKLEKETQQEIIKNIKGKIKSRRQDQIKALSKCSLKYKENWIMIVAKRIRLQNKIDKLKLLVNEINGLKFIKNDDKEFELIIEALEEQRISYNIEICGIILNV